jgi:hypothetical protein
MARLITLDGVTGPEEPIGHLMPRHLPSGCLVAFEHLPEGRQIVSRLDVMEVNAVATELAGGKTVYGDAILFSTSELGG